ncbi:unnamed protein product [Rotaria socialis]|uniref:Isoleucine--tRNA ligase, cytoplasmic n=1 Tax=Rotaria socialis TaxID=392032 RepID=A0A818VT22_9BILA|nr:unnamed protein product [Rotaria socialis]CAF3715736.1 unnamed protein product [Rotaria socialis]CAF4513352.1 unnamed protein product [Rotaria socialis]CAF4769910.1 unnamed protein product [Rotaria socialis]
MATNTETTTTPSTILEFSIAGETLQFGNNEKNILAYWKQINAFETSNKLSKDRPKYTFYDGPPFATGLPHYGHILAGTIKDTVTRWAYQTGYHVERRFGWDCHGLPVEYEIDKTLEIKGPEDVAKMGIATYNNHCRKIVMRYAQEWEDVVDRMGRWIDFRRDYKTMYPWFMESVWFVFKQLYEKGFVYRGFKVMPYSMGCCTPLSNFEAGQNYKDIDDPAVWVSFPLTDDPTVKLVAWTTTPWTLPSNLALCVNPNSVYVKILDKTKNEVFILMEKRLAELYKKPDSYQILESFKGSHLKEMHYTPLFPYFSNVKTAFRILCDDYVTEDSGTGVVHQAPYFGEDDYRVCLAHGVINKDAASVICPIDAQCRFTAEVTDFQGQNVKDADKPIIKYLKEAKRLVHQAVVKHSYPFCWRSDTPLIYRAVPSWFVRVEGMIDRLLANNSKTYWVPDFVKEKRFANWLRDARDWAISRNRYWGNPMPLWISDDGHEVVCVGSIEELKQLSGVSVDDLHREFVDQITIPSRLGKGLLRRIPEVFDCWFESGSMPYAQVHYPFDGRRTFPDTFPADFIAEGIDQTRGWFYTLLVISTALFDQPPFKNLIVNGIVLASDGEKMSKRKKNYPDPMEIFDEFGADALRLYLITSPVVRGESLKFKKEGVRDILKDVFLPWYNALRLLIQSCDQLKVNKKVNFIYDEKRLYSSMSSNSNVMDTWIVSYTQTLLDFVRKEMEAYRLYTVVPRLVKYIDMLTNWYVKLNKKRFKSETTLDDCLVSLNVLCYVLLTMAKLMAPFTPFLAEYMYQILRKLMPQSSSSLSHEQELSVHFQMIPKSHHSLVNKNIERAVAAVQTVIGLGRVVRERKVVPMKYPLPEFVVIHKDSSVLKDVESLEDFVREGLNVRKVTLSQDRELYGVEMRAEPNYPTLGKKAGSKVKSVTEKIRGMSNIDVEKLLLKGEGESPLTVIDDVPIEFEDIHIVYRVAKQMQYEATAEQGFVVLLDYTADASLKDEGLIREITSRIQKLRKEAKVTPTDDILVYYSVEPQTSEIARVALEQREEIEVIIQKPFLPLAERDQNPVVIEKKFPIKDGEIEFVITRKL